MRRRSRVRRQEPAGGLGRPGRISAWTHPTTPSSSAEAPAARPSRRPLSRAGRKVLVLERERFPRFHVGESLLPFALPIFERLGVARKGPRRRLPGEVRRVLLERVQRHDAPGRLRRGARHESSDGVPGQARRVRRAPAPPLGLVRRRGPRGDVSSTRSSSRDRARSASACTAGRPASDRASARASSWTPRGRAPSSRASSGCAASTRSSSAPRSSRTTPDIVWPEGSRPGDILLPIDKGVWYWIIPFSDGTCSVGGVFDPAEVRFAGPSVEARFEEMLGRSPRMRELLGRARRTSKVHGVSDYSAVRSEWAATAGCSSETRRRSWIRSSRPASSSRCRRASAPGPRSSGALARAAAWTRATSAPTSGSHGACTRRFRKFVYNFYDPVFFDAFCDAGSRREDPRRGHDHARRRRRATSRPACGSGRADVRGRRARSLHAEGGGRPRTVLRAHRSASS